MDSVRSPAGQGMTGENCFARSGGGWGAGSVAKVPASQQDGLSVTSARCGATSFNLSAAEVETGSPASLA